MVFGHNANLKLGAATLHIQTEDRGEAHALIDTTVYFQGRVLHRRTNHYHDLLPMDDARRQALKLRVDEQHRAVMDEIRTGKLSLTIPQPSVGPPPASHGDPSVADAPSANKLTLELRNAKSWLSGGRAILEIVVKGDHGRPVANARVEAYLDGSADGPVSGADTDAQGQTRIEFAMPRISGAEPALVIRASHSSGLGQLRFALRARTRVPSV